MAFSLRSIFCGVAGATFMLFAQTAQGFAEEGERLALLIGNSRYEHATPLKNPENDVDLMETSLKQAGFQTFAGKNLTLSVFKSLVDKFLEKAKAATRPKIVVFFAGHGVQFSGENYLIPVDAGVASAEAVAAASVSATALLKTISASDPRLAVLILDACRNDPFENAGRSLLRGLSSMQSASLADSRSSQLIAFSTSPGKVASDGDTGNSPFASALAENLIIAGMSLEAVFRETRRKVIERTKGAQEPWEHSSLYEEFVFIPEAEQSAIGVDEATIWDFASIVNTAEGYQRYLDRYPSGLFSAIAKQKIAAINKDFSYRRKAELFPIFTRRMKDVPGCRPGVDHFSFFDELRQELQTLQGQLVYVDFQASLAFVFCDYNGGINHGRADYIKPVSGNCEQIFVRTETFDSTRLQCIPPENYGMSVLKEPQSVFAEGGMKLNLADLTVIMPAGRREFYSFVVDPGEAVLSDASIRSQGLVRLRVSREEAEMYVVLEPVDPKEVGLSWKFDNTRRMANDRLAKLDSGVTSEASSRAGSSADYQYFENASMEGFDSSILRRLSFDECETSCSAETDCLGFVYDKWNSVCFLKDSLTERRLDPKYRMGVRSMDGGSSWPNIPAASGRASVEFYRGKHFPERAVISTVVARDYRECGGRCESTDGCIAFSFLGRNREARTGGCELMSSVGEYFSKRGVDSGVLRQAP